MLYFDSSSRICNIPNDSELAPFPHCQCHMDTNTQIWTMEKEIWKSLNPEPPKFSADFAALRDYACSVSVDRNTVIFFGGHYLKIKVPDPAYPHEDNRYVPVQTPFNDQVFEYSFKTQKWTKFQNVPNIQVYFTLDFSLVYGFCKKSCFSEFLTFARCKI